MNSSAFVHLHVHSEYSLVNGIAGISNLLQAARSRGIPALALTDQQNLFAAVKFYREALACGIKPILGAEVLLAGAHNKVPTSLVLLCQNLEGYRNLTQLLTRAYIECGEQTQPLLQAEWLAQHHDGLIVLSGGSRGDIAQAILARDLPLAYSRAKHWRDLLGDRFYLEIFRTGQAQENFLLNNTLELARQLHIAVVATNDVCFVDASDYEAHEARVCIHEGNFLNGERRVKNYSEAQYLKSAAEMQQLFQDIPQALSNTLEIAKRCNFQLTLDQVSLPEFPVPPDQSVENTLLQAAQSGLEKRFASFTYEVDKAVYQQRLSWELSVINPMGFASYFLIVADFIAWALSQQIPVGPGRGSGAGSLVAYALGITDVDPIAHDLLFERFLNPERISMPDFDIDFCMDRRDEVIEYVTHKYGREAVAQIITYGTMAAKAVVRDVGRVLGMPYGFVDKIAKLIPFEIGMTLEKALEQEQELRDRYQQEEEVRVLLDLARKLEGVTRNAGKNASGLVIAPGKIVDYVALYCEPGSQSPVTQFDKDDIEAIGLVKFDFLGLRTLTIIDWALQAINKKRREQQLEAVDISQIDLNDPQTYQLLKSCQSTAVFQFESQGMKDLIRRLQPNCFDDIIHTVALFRPGPLQSGMVDDFIDRKHGRAAIEYMHPELELILRSTCGVILYQEQVMRIAQSLAGYTLGGADLLRRAMGKKKPEEMARQRSIFLKGALDHGLSAETAQRIFDLMEKFAGYGFNKSHSVAYALISYRTAWLKAHYPAPYMAAVLSADMDNADKVVHLLHEVRNLGLQIEAPDINRSDFHFTVTETGSILYGLGAIKGLSLASSEHLLQIRQQQGGFRDLFHFCQSVGDKKCNRRVYEALILSGACDNFGWHRASLMATLDNALALASQATRSLQQGMLDLFAENDLGNKNNKHVEVAPWSRQKNLEGEQNTLGWYFSGHPLQSVAHELKPFISTSLGEFRAERTQTVMLAGVVGIVRTRMTRKGDRMAFVTLSDASGQIEIAVFPERYQQSQAALVKDNIVIVEADVVRDEVRNNYRVVTRKLYTLDELRAIYARRLVLNLPATRVNTSLLNSIQQILHPFAQGHCPVFIEYVREDVTAQIPLGEKWLVQPCQALLLNLESLLGAQSAHFDYSS